MSVKASDSIQQAISGIMDEISKLKGSEADLELRRFNKLITRELYNTEIKLLKQKEEQLLSEKEDILAKYYASRAPKYEEEDIQSLSDENSSDAINLTDEAEFPKNSKERIEERRYCRFCGKCDCMCSFRLKVSDETLLYLEQGLLLGHELPLFRCPECYEIMRSANRVRQHLRLEHNFGRVQDPCVLRSPDFYEEGYARVTLNTENMSVNCFLEASN